MSLSISRPVQPVAQERDQPIRGGLGYRITKRVLDLLGSVVGLAVLGPFLLLIAVLIRLTSPGPALFRQARVGRDEKPFTMLKFRTMHVGRSDAEHRAFVRQQILDPALPAPGTTGSFKLQNDARITGLGRVLRRTSLDELPQLLNVLVGQMSLVGPRPVLPWEAELFSPRHRRRFDVLPGLTGRWQTSGRSRLSMREALDLDISYVEEQGLWLDLKILVKTVFVLLAWDRTG